MSELNDQRLLEWKVEYDSIYSISVRGEEYVFRPLTFGEYNRLLKYPKDLSVLDQEDYIVRTALLWPEKDVDSISPGVVSALSENIANVSGITDPTLAKNIMEDKRREAQNLQGTMYSFVLATMPTYSVEDLDQLNFSQLAKKVALAERIIEIQQTVSIPDNRVTFDLIDPAEEEARRKAEEEENRKRYERVMQSGRFGDPDKAPPLKQKIKPNDPIVEKLRSALG